MQLLGWNLCNQFFNQTTPDLTHTTAYITLTGVVFELYITTVSFRTFFRCFYVERITNTILWDPAFEQKSISYRRIYIWFPLLCDGISAHDSFCLPKRRRLSIRVFQFNSPASYSDYQPGTRERCPLFRVSSAALSFGVAIDGEMRLIMFYSRFQYELKFSTCNIRINIIKAVWPLKFTFSLEWTCRYHGLTLTLLPSDRCLPLSLWTMNYILYYTQKEWNTLVLPCNLPNTCRNICQQKKAVPFPPLPLYLLPTIHTDKIFPSQNTSFQISHYWRSAVPTRELTRHSTCVTAPRTRSGL